MKFMFYNARACNRNVSGWGTSRVTSMDDMFQDARKFNQDISAWDTSKVIYMDGMFYNAIAFNQNISGWDTSNVEADADGFTNMFDGATSFNARQLPWFREEMLLEE